MRKIVLLIFIILFCMICFIQCNNCDSDELSDKKFTQDELNILPYLGTEKLTFKNNNGDSLCFTGQGRISQMYQQHALMDPDMDDECLGDYRMIETVSLQFIGENCDTTIDFSLRFFHPFDSHESEKNFSIRFNYIDTHEHTTFHGTYSFETGLLTNPIQFNWDEYSFITAYYDTITLVNKTFHNVYELSRDVSNILPEYQYLQITSVYYSIYKGIVGYKKTSGTIWYLQE